MYPIKKVPITLVYRLCSCLGILFFQTAIAQNLIPTIGQWREHLNYQHTIQLIKGDQLYCATTTNVFAITPQNEIQRYSKMTGLSDIGVQCIGWDSTTRQLIIAYSNSNIDLLKNNNTKNIGDIKRSQITGNKTIYSVYCRDGLAYLASGLGIIVINLTKNEIKDTWFIGNNGNQVKVNACTSDNQYFYAATDEGLKTIAINSPDPSNYANWKNQMGLSKGMVKNVVNANHTIIAEQHDSLFILQGNQWNLLYSDLSWPITQMSTTDDKLLISQKKSINNARVIVLNTNGSIEKIIVQDNLITDPRSAITLNGLIWIADYLNGLSSFGTSVEQYVPNGPPGIADGEMIHKDNRLFAAAGSIDINWQGQKNKKGVFDFSQDSWHFKNQKNLSGLDSVWDFIALAIDPVNQSLWAGSYGGGLVNFTEAAAPVVYKNNNSSLQEALQEKGSYRVSGLAFDQNNHLWISNYGAAKNLQIKKADGNWKAFTIPFSHAENAVGQLLVDDDNQIWIVSPKNNGLFCYNPGQSLDNTTDDRWKFYKQGAGNGNLPSNNVLCIVKDKNGFIWVGTDRGIGIIQCTGEVFSAQGCDALLPIVQQDRFAGLLFKDETVQTIAVDGANRKWIGTKNGVWLLSPDGNKIIYRFTEENSPLLNNDCRKISIDAISGEVFIATTMGICSFRSTATEGEATNEKVLVFPNPVPPNYTGTIAIRGLVENALVKITELNGKLVYQTRSLGGQAIWDGRNYLGQKIASGLYLVIIRDDAGTEKITTKIIITGGR